MDKHKALDFTIDRIESIKQQTYSKESEIKIAKETIEYLEFIKNMLEEDKQ